MKTKILLTIILTNFIFLTANAQLLDIDVISGGSVRIGKVTDAGNTAVPLESLAAQYNIDFTGYRDLAPDQIGARIAALRFNCFQPNSALIQKTGLAFYTNPIGQSAGTTDLVERLRIDPNGNVGIGTTSPNYKLEVMGSTRFQGDVWASDKLTFQDNARFTVTNSDVATLNVANFSMPHYGIAAPTTGGAADLWMAGNNGIRMFTAGNPVPKFNILANGKVGIGTTTPDELLTVKGIIHAQEVKIDMNGALVPDYVFDSNYKLMPLSEVEQFVNTNKHLPSIPSATEVQTNGMNMGDMQNKLLQKIEELTLYMIEQQKTITEQQRQINELKEQINSK